MRDFLFLEGTSDIIRGSPYENKGGYAALLRGETKNA